jgi:hypothetical protein
MSTLAATLQGFFTDRLIRQRQASPHTLAAYRDTWKLVLAFAVARTGIQPSRLAVQDLDAPLIGEFLNHLEPSAATVSAPATPPRGDPLAVPLRRHATPRTRRHDPASAGHPTQTV